MKQREVCAALRSIALAHGGALHPADIVKAARPESSPLHSRFEWSDTAAARKYRLWQARQLISIVVEDIGGGAEPILTRVFVSLTPDREAGGYRSLRSILQNPEQRKQLLADAFEEMERFAEKYHQLKELAQVFAAMRRAQRRTRGRAIAA
jgi:hypothetical protein